MENNYYQRAVEWVMTSGLHIELIAAMAVLGVRLLR